MALARLHWGECCTDRGGHNERGTFPYPNLLRRWNPEEGLPCTTCRFVRQSSYFPFFPSGKKLLAERPLVSKAKQASLREIANEFGILHTSQSWNGVQLSYLGVIGCPTANSANFIFYKVLLFPKLLTKSPLSLSLSLCTPPSKSKHTQNPCSDWFQQTICCYGCWPSPEGWIFPLQQA